MKITKKTYKTRPTKILIETDVFEFDKLKEALEVIAKCQVSASAQAVAESVSRWNLQKKY